MSKRSGLAVGDTVEVIEVESPWIEGAWQGEVRSLCEDGSANVKPVDPNVKFRVQPIPSYLATGLFLTSKDSIVKLAEKLNTSPAPSTQS